MITHFRTDEGGNMLLYPGRQIKDRGLFPYSYEVYDGKYDREDNLHEDPLLSEVEQERMMDYLDHMPSYDPEKIEFALEEMVERNNGKIPRITLLLDNSGSTRGQVIQHIALISDVIGKACDRLGIPLEILGNTTVEWKGGQVRKDWLQERTPAPGRLNDIRHVIYKDRHHSFEESRKNLGLMFKEGFLKENIDGEAIEWVYERIYQTNKPGNIILHIADGAPVDDSTLSVNPGDFLLQHYRQATEFVTKQADTNIYAIGVGHRNVQGVFNGAIDVTSGHDDKNFSAICNYIAGMRIPDVLPQEGISESGKKITNAVTDIVKQLLDLFGEHSTVVSHKNFCLLSDELKKSIYDFFIGNEGEVSEELRSTIMNFILDGNPEEIHKKMEVVLDMDFLKKWMLWNEQVGYRTIDEFLNEDYVDSVKDANIATFSSFIEGFKSHGSIVFKILNYLIKIDDEDFVARLTHHIATKMMLDDGIKDYILEGLKSCSHYYMIEYYSSLNSEEERNGFVSQLLQILDDLHGNCNFDPVTFCVLHQAGINKAYSTGLHMFFNPSSVQERSEMDRLKHRNVGVEMFPVDENVLKLKSSHVWEYFKFRFEIFAIQVEVGLPLEAITYSKDTHENADELNEMISDFKNQEYFLRFAMRKPSIENINKLPEEVFSALVKNKDIFSFRESLRSGEFLLLEPYFSNPYFLSLISDTKNTFNKNVYDYLMMHAKKGEFFEIDEDFLDTPEIGVYLGEKMSVGRIMNWLTNDSESIDTKVLQSLVFLASRTQMIDETSLQVALSEDGKKRDSFTGMRAVHMMIRNYIYNFNVRNERNIRGFKQDVLGDMYEFFQGVLGQEEVMMSISNEAEQVSLAHALGVAKESIARLGEYHEAFLQAERKALSLEKKEEDEYQTEFGNIKSFMTMSQGDFDRVYIAYVRKFNESQNSTEQSIFKSLNNMRDLFKKVRAWK